MATLYLVEQNTILRKRGNRFLLCKRPPASRRYCAVLQRDIILDLPCADVDHVMLFGNIQVTTSALHKMLEKGVELALFNFGGELLGQLTPPMGKNISLRLLQFYRFRDQQFVLNFSRQIVSAKIKNALTFLQEHHKNNPSVFDLIELRNLRSLIRKAETVTDMEALRGIEGAAAAKYFNLFGKMIKPPWKFAVRTRRPPRDAVNAVLSFGYVITGARLQSLLDGIGLDPYLGFFHQIDYGRPGLALDILEEFRHPLVDRLATILFNKGILRETDFFKPTGGGVYLNTSGKRKYLEHYQNALGELFPTNQTGGKKGYIGVFQQQIGYLTDAIKEGIPYRPWLFS